MTDLRTTPLDVLHRELGARMVPFAGWLLPLQYEGITREHLWCREHAALFDVSHMGQVTVRGDGIARALEALVPSDLLALSPGRSRYSVLTNDRGGAIDDLILANDGERGWFLVVNAARREVDLEHLRAHLPGLSVELLHDRALLALQGPEAGEVLARHVPAVRGLFFMDAGWFDWDGIDVRISRSGYTGEDGFEISCPAPSAVDIARTLLADSRVKPAGLGARDTLRLEAGLCLYGHELDEETTPVEAGLAWIIGRRRREEGGFPGAEVILRQLREGPPRRLVGLRPEGRLPVREGTPLSDGAGHAIGRVTSGTFGPSVGAPVAMGFVETRLSEPGTGLRAEVRGRPVDVFVATLPFVPHRYRRRGRTS